MAETRLDQLSRLYAEYGSWPFPAGFTSREPGGHCMAMMDTMLSGCIASVLEGPLDDWRRDVLTARIPVLVEVLPSISHDAYGTEYFTHLHRMAVIAAEIDHARGPVPSEAT